MMTDDLKKSLFIPIALLLLAILPMPYGFYATLRMGVTIFAAILIYTEYNRQKSMNGWAYVWVCVAVLFNPLVPIHSARLFWFFADIGTAGLFEIYRRQYVPLPKDRPD